MDLLDDFARVRETFQELGEVSNRFDSTSAEEPPTVAATASVSYDLPALSVDISVRQAAR